MSRKSFHPGRRRWLKLGWAAALSIAIPRVARAQASKPDAPPTRVDENEPQAQALGYKEDAARVDKAKFKNVQPGERCSNCKFFKGRAGDPWGPCDVFDGRKVSAKGWCAAWGLPTRRRRAHARRRRRAPRSD
jgi:hypothetical protein